MEPSIWKLSMGRGASGGEFSNLAAVRHWTDEGLVLVWGPTRGTSGGPPQGDLFRQASNGDLFYLCHGNDVPGILLLGELIGEANPIVVPNGRPDWYARRFRLIRNAGLIRQYEGVFRVWSPRGVSTFVRVPEAQYPEFESDILEPYFEMTTEMLLNQAAGV